MVWGLVIMLAVMVGLCMHLLAVSGGWKERAQDAERVISVIHSAPNTMQHERSLRMYCVKWGMVMSGDGIHEKRSK